MPDRIIRESICTSDTIDELSWFEEVLWHRLTVNCDDFGRFDARPEILKGRLFPLKTDLALKDIRKAIQKLSAVGLVGLYEYDGKPYLQLVTWRKYQRVRAKNSKYPDPPHEFDNACCQMTANVAESENRESRDENRESNTVDDFFESVWKLYPKKEGKGQVSATQKAKLQKIGYDQIARCIERYEITKKDTERQYWQNGSTFFNSGYVDYLDENYDSSQNGPQNGDKNDDGQIYHNGKWVNV